MAETNLVTGKEAETPGSAECWYRMSVNTVLTCPRCGKFTPDEDQVHLSPGGCDPVGILNRMRAILAVVRGEIPHVRDYHTSEKTTEKALRGDDGQPLLGVVVCPDCATMHKHTEV